MINFLILVLDLAIIGIALWVLKMLVGYGGFIGKALRFMGIGTVIIGFAQLVETIMLDWLTTAGPYVEVAHRILLVIGFIFIAFGYKKLMTKPAV